MKKIVYILVLITFMLCIDKINAYTEYKIGDEITYNGIKFYVIKDSSKDEDNVTMLKAQPLTVEEVNKYGVGHVNIYYSNSNYGLGNAYNYDGYGGMAYYSNETCGGGIFYGCITSYTQSEVKYVVDNWTQEKISRGLVEARLMTINEVTNLGYEYFDNGSIQSYNKTESTPSWLYNGIHWYWTMSQHNDSSTSVWIVFEDGNLSIGNVIAGSNGYDYGLVRPVITLKKTALGDEDESIIDDKEKEDTKIDVKDNIDDNKSNESKATVKVANTYMSSSIIIIILGFIIASVSVFVLYKVRNKSIK